MWSGLAYTLVQMSFNRFTGGDTSYGYRLGLELLACATPAVAFTAHRMGRVARRVIGPVVAVQFFAIFLGASLDSFYVAQLRGVDQQLLPLRHQAQPWDRDLLDGQRAAGSSRATYVGAFRACREACDERARGMVSSPAVAEWRPVRLRLPACVPAAMAGRLARRPA